jgi:GNAT superfamily N-acetyltransferase
MNFREISYEQCLTLWKLLWANRVSPIEPVSAMALPTDFNKREYSKDIGSPTFIGAFDGDQLVGVNSFHRVDDQVRSRGLYVLGSHRGNGLGSFLLMCTLEMALAKYPMALIWSFPREEAIASYERAGFELVSDMIDDPVENKRNCYAVA